MQKIQLIAIVVVVIFAVAQTILIPPVASSKEPKEEQTCHLREIDLCLAPLAVLAQGRGAHPISNQEINRQCKMLLETEECMQNYTSRCMTPMQGQMVNLFSEHGFETIRDLCKPKTDLYNRYLKHGNCINGQHNNHKVCIRDFQAAVEKAADASFQDRLKIGCW